MEMLAPFDQAKLLNSVQTHSPSASYGCCLALSLEWVRLALYKYQTAGKPDAELRADLLKSQISTIANYQDICNEFNRESRRQGPDAPARFPHQARQCYIANYVGRQTEVIQQADAELRATEESVEAVKFKMGDNEAAWKAIGKELMTPDSYHLALVKGTKDGKKWHHAVALWSYQDNGNAVAHVFDPNNGEVKIPQDKLGGTIEEVVQRCESGAALHALRYIRVEKGMGYTAGIGT